MPKKYYSILRLADSEGNEYSANPSDYFWMKPKEKFKNLGLFAIKHEGEWERIKLLKRNPTLNDLVKWNKKMEKVI